MPNQVDLRIVLPNFRDGVRHHFVASIATAETTARNRARFLDSFWTYRKSAIEEGRSESVAAYAIKNEGDIAAVRKLAGILAEHGIEVSRATAAFTGCGREGDFPVGSLIVELAQPAKRLIRTILDADVPLGGDFLEEQERRRKRNLPDEIYDVTGWSLPQLFNVETVTCDVVPTGDFEPAGSERVTAATITGGRARVAYLAPWGTAAAGRLLAGALRADLRVLAPTKRSCKADERTRREHSSFPWTRIRRRCTTRSTSSRARRAPRSSPPIPAGSKAV